MMIKTSTKVVLLLAVLMGTGSVMAQGSFQDFVKEQGFSWVVGRWTAQMDGGETIELTYRWAVKGQMIISTFKMGEEAYQGIIYLIADEEKVVEAGVHSDGGRSKATWVPQGDKLVSTREKIDSYGDVQKMAIVFSKGKARTMSVAIHAYEYGSLADEAMATLEFKRQPGRKKGKAKSK
jgi:hypothetical protein